MNSTAETTKSEQRSKKPRKASAPPSFAESLFRGKILSDRIFPYPPSTKDEDELLNMTLRSIQKFAETVNVQRIEEEKKIPPEYLARMKELGLFGLIIPEEYGGFGFSVRNYLQILSAVSLIDPNLSTTLGAHQSIGLKALLMFGSPEQKNKYLPKLATGELIAAFGLTEPGAGSDARNLRTTAELSTDGSHYVLNGNKIWITNGGIANFFTVFARTFHHDEKKERITGFIITRDMAGFSSGPEEKKLGLLGSSTTGLHFENVKVPSENVIGEPGKGFKIAMAVLNNGRIGLAGTCALAIKWLIQTAMEHALQRKQFGKSLSEFELIQSKFANMLIENFAAESMAFVTARLIDSGVHDYSLETAMCKVFSTESEWRAANECLQIAGGAGYMKEYPYEKVLRDSRILTIWEGANEILRLFIGLSGLQGPGEQLKEISETLRKPLHDVLKSIGVLSDFGVRWIQKRVTKPEHLKGMDPFFSREAEVFDKYTALLAMESERLLLKFGKNIIHKEFMVKRLADVAIDLYAIACSLSRGTDLIQRHGANKVDYEITLVKAFCRKARRRMAENFRRIDKNDDSLEISIANHFYERNGFAREGF